MPKLGTIGERKIIETILKQLEQIPKMTVPFGDDVAAYPISDSRLAILKTDMLVGKTDVPPTMSLWQAARKAVVMNVSDFAAKGVKPLAVLVSLGLPATMTEKDAREIGRGLNSGAREYGAYIVGGDTGEASDVIISVSLFGFAEKSMLMLRSDAKAGDVVAVTGSFGKTSAGLRVLLNEVKATRKVRDALVESVLMPHARLDEGLALSGTRAVTSSIDSSDGLAWSLHEVAKASKVGFLIDSLPTAREVEEFAKLNSLDPAELTLYGGEEYELVLTVEPEFWDKAEEAVEKVCGKLLRIGEVTADSKIVLKLNGVKREIEARGYEHFKTSKS